MSKYSFNLELGVHACPLIAVNTSIYDNQVLTCDVHHLIELAFRLGLVLPSRNRLLDIGPLTNI